MVMYNPVWVNFIFHFFLQFNTYADITGKRTDKQTKDRIVLPVLHLC